MLNRRSLQPLLLTLGVAALYIGFAKLGLGLAIQARQVTAVWPPTGFALAVVLLFGWRSVPGIFLGAFIANATTDEPLLVAAGIAVGNSLEAIVGTALLRRIGFDSRLARVRDVTALLVAVLASPLVSATIGVASLGLGGLHPLENLPALWRVWWVGDALGALVVAPFLLVWSREVRLAPRPRVDIEKVVFFAALAALCTIAFVRFPEISASEYVVFPFLIWAALRFGPSWTATTAVVIDAIAVWGTILGRGPFAGAGPEQGLVLLQVFVAVATTTALLLGAVAAQNRDAQARAEISERRLLLAMSAAKMVVWEWDIATGKIIWSEGLEPLHGLPPGAFAGTFDAFRELIHPDDVQAVDAAIWKSVVTCEPYEAEFRILQPDSLPRWIAARGQVVTDDSGHAIRTVGLGIDVTRQKELEAELRAQASELADADRRKNEFLAMLSHELRNPLMPIVHAVELLGSSEPALAEEAREIVRRQVDHITRLVDDLLDVARITRGGVQLQRRRVSLAEVVRPAVNTWRYLIEERRQHLSVEIPESPIWVDVDPARLTQVIANLLHNAVKFTPDGGWISITAREENGRAVVRVRDTGEGMSGDVAAHAFDLFVQGAAPPLYRPHGGLGLGLTLVRSLVELHGGSVSASSAGVGRGSEFSLFLPIAEAPSKTEEARIPIADSSGVSGDRRVLLVEDHPDTRMVLTLLLERDGYEVRAASDGYRALAEAQRFTPDLVILDIGLPGMDGYAVARELRAMPHCADALIVGLSGYGQTKDQELARAAGFDHHLLKPIDPPVLLEFLREKMAARA